MAADAITVHASAVLAGSRAVLIRGAAGSGKSRLALALIQSAATGALPFARLVADDRVALGGCHGRVIARAPASLAGLIEVRGLGIQRVAFEPIAVVGWVVDLSAADGVRLPAPPERETLISGVKLPRLRLSPEADPLLAVLAMLQTAEAGI